jgi:hypothetical protein
LSEFTILKAAVDKGMWLVIGIFLFFIALVFYGVLSAFGKMLFGAPGAISDVHLARFKASRFSMGNMLGNAVMIALAAAIIVTGIRVPGFIDETIRACVLVLGVK